MLLEAEQQGTQSRVVDDIKDEMDDLIKGLESELEKTSKTTNEGLLTTASIAVALPAIMGLVAKFGKAAGNIVNKMMGKKPSQEDDYQQWMNKLGNIADELHHLYMTPIKGIVKKFVKDGEVVYGFTKDGKVFLNDPNTTSGMMPSSFFFHQAAEIGLNPSQFLTYIIKTSICKRSISKSWNIS